MDAPFLFVDEVETAGRHCLVRLDLNVPLADGTVTDDTRIRRILPGLEALRQAGARIIILTHLGRPKGKVAPEFSVAPVAARLSELLGCPVPVEADLTANTWWNRPSPRRCCAGHSFAASLGVSAKHSYWMPLLNV